MSLDCPGFGRSAVGLPHQSEADSICKELQDGCAQSPATVHAVESWVIAAVLAQYMDRVLCLATRTVQSDLAFCSETRRALLTISLLRKALQELSASESEAWRTKAYLLQS